MGSKLFVGILLVLGLTGLSVTYIHFEGDAYLSTEQLSEIYTWGLMKIKNQELAKRIPRHPDVEPNLQILSSATNALVKTIPLTVNTPIINHPVKLNAVHGTITSNEEPLQGVTIMVPDSKTAQVSNANGKYYIQVPGNAASLLFIYQGKQLAKALDPNSKRLDVDLTIESMEYPEIETPQINEELIADN